MIYLKRIGLVLCVPIAIVACVVFFVFFILGHIILGILAITGLPYIFTGEFNGWEEWYAARTKKIGEFFDEAL